MILQPRVIELLHKRGLSTEEEIEEFLSARPQKTYDPFLLLNMEAGVDLILSSIEDEEKICIYGDYDADGITSTAVLMEVLSQLTDNLAYYIPSRFEEGYGLNCEALDKIKAAGVDLVVTVDCGSVSCMEVEHAKEIGLKILVTDHHTIKDQQGRLPAHQSQAAGMSLSVQGAGRRRRSLQAGPGHRGGNRPGQKGGQPDPGPGGYRNHRRYRSSGR